MTKRKLRILTLTGALLIAFNVHAGTPASPKRKKPHAQPVPLHKFEDLKAVQGAAAFEALGWSIQLAQQVPRSEQLKLIPILHDADIASIPPEYLAAAGEVFQATAASSLKMLARRGDSAMPILHLIEFKDGEAVVLTGFGTSRVPRGSTPRLQAGTVFISFVDNFSSTAWKSFKDLQRVAYYGIGIAFPTAAESVGATASLLVFVPRESAKMFAAGEITDAKLASDSIAFLYEPSAGGDFVRFNLRVD